MYQHDKYRRQRSNAFESYRADRQTCGQTDTRNRPTAVPGPLKWLVNVGQLLERFFGKLTIQTLAMSREARQTTLYV